MEKNNSLYEDLRNVLSKTAPLCDCNILFNNENYIQFYAFIINMR